MIPNSFIQQLVSQCDIEDLIGNYVDIKKLGKNSKSLCPFHSEKTPSMVVYPDSQSFFCFGCGAGGDAITFIKLIENLDYVESIKFLANRMGLEVPNSDIDDKQSKLRQKIYEINRETARFFHTCLKKDFGKIGYSYFKQRDLSDATIVHFGLGYAPDSWNSLCNHLLKKGYTKDEMVAAAVCVNGKNNSCYDQFRNRVMFPILDLRGNVIAFGGRVLDDSKPKYLNTGDTMVFKKSKNLFSLNFAKNEIKDKVILAEGYMDVIAIYQAGFKNVVATLGTALTSEQSRLLAKYAKQVVLAYDSDEAGQKATHRATNFLSEAGVATRVLQLNNAKDPDEFLQKFGATRFSLLIDGASDVIEYELNAIKLKCHLKTAEGKIEYLKQAVNIIADVKNPLEREVYASTISRETGSQVETILTSAMSIFKKKMAYQQKREWKDIEQNKAIVRDKINPQKHSNLRQANSEEAIISILFKHPDRLDNILGRISPDDFVTEFNRRVFISIIESIKQDENANVTLSSIASLFESGEISAISGILARNSNIINVNESLDEYVKILLSYKEKLSKVDILNINTDQIEKYRQQLKTKK